MTAYEDVRACSWKHGVEGHPRFIRGRRARASRAAAGCVCGVLWIGELRHRGSIVVRLRRHRLDLRKLAYDRRYTRNSRSAPLLTAHLMHQVIDVDRVQIVDYLSGDDAYKRDWMSARRERWGLRAYRLRSVAGLAGARARSPAAWRGAA